MARASREISNSPMYIDYIKSMKNTIYLEKRPDL